MERKRLRLKLDDITDAGEIAGHGSVKNNLDLSGEIVVAGAFKRTLGATGGVLPMLWNHRHEEPIGMWNSMKEDGKGLAVTGKLNLEVQRARETHALLKQGAVKGLSIGYDVTDSKIEKGVRHLTELKLWEVSVVTFPANERALVESVKSAAFAKYLPDFGSMNDEAQSRAALYSMLDTIGSVLSASRYESEMTTDEVAASVDVSLEQFHQAALEWLTVTRAQTDADGKALAFPGEIALGSSQVLRAIEGLKALLEGSKANADPGDFTYSDEPPEHDGPAGAEISSLSRLIEQIRSSIHSV